MVALDLIASKSNFTNQLLDLSSSNTNPINAHTNSNTCHQSMPSSNIFIFKPIIILVDINTQNRATFYLVIDTLKICSHVVLLQNPKPFPLVPLLSPPIPPPLMLLLMFRQDKDLTRVLSLVYLDFHSCLWMRVLSMLNVLHVEVFLLNFSSKSFLSFVVVHGHMHRTCWRHSLLKYKFV